MIHVHSWRDSNGNEVDLIVDKAGVLTPVEIKSGQTVSDDWFKGLERWLKLVGEKGASPTLIYGGEESYTHRGVDVLSWRQCTK